MKKAVALLLTLCLLLSVSACNGDADFKGMPENTGNNASAAESSEQLSESDSATAQTENNNVNTLDESGLSGTLNVYIQPFFSQSYLTAIEHFKTAAPNLKVNLVFYRGEEDYLAALDAYREDGTLPDLLVVSQENDIYDLSRMASDGLFLDLNTYLKQDDTYVPEEYYESVLLAGVYNQEQALIPLLFTVPCLFTSEEVLPRLALPENYTCAELLCSVVSYAENVDEETDDGYAYAYVALPTYEESLLRTITSSGVELFDPVTRELSLPDNEIPPAEQNEYLRKRHGGRRPDGSRVRCGGGLPSLRGVVEEFRRADPVRAEPPLTSGKYALTAEDAALAAFPFAKSH